MKRTTLLSAATPLAVAAAAILAVGDLNPPAGAVAATGKRLTEIEPRIALNATNTPGIFDCVFLIAEPGSYYLTGNLQGVAGKHGIKVVSSNVKIDLNGFDVVGAAGMGPYDGILALGNPIENINVRNGTVRGWGDEGLDLAAAQYSRVDDLTANGNVGDGIITGPLSIVRGCSANANSGAGIRTASGSTIERCVAGFNVVACILAGSTNSVTGCSAYASASTGILTGTSCNVTACTTSNNNGVGISVGNGSSVFDCTSRGNLTDGILASSATLIRGNHCAFNGGGGDGAGIHVTSGDCRIEGNNCTGADRGIDVDATGNVILRNTCSGNTTNWDIVAGNAFGPIVLTTAGAAVAGNTATSSLGSTDPNANFTY